jgi:hypothetical protein
MHTWQAPIQKPTKVECHQFDMPKALDFSKNRAECDDILGDAYENIRHSRRDRNCVCRAR